MNTVAPLSQVPEMVRSALESLDKIAGFKITRLPGGEFGPPPPGGATKVDGATPSVLPQDSKHMNDMIKTYRIIIMRLL
jgi:hypothetical protein